MAMKMMMIRVLWVSNATFEGEIRCFGLDCLRIFQKGKEMVRHVVYFLVEEQLHSNTWLVIAWACDVSTSSDWSMQGCAQWVGAPRASVQPPNLRVRIGFSPSPNRGPASTRTTNNNHWQGTRTAESWRGPKKSKLCETADGPALG